MAQADSGGFDTGDWCWHTRQATPCRVVERLALWGEAAYRVWLREFRRRRLQAEHEARLAALDEMETTVPELNAVAMVRIDAKANRNSEGAA